jgi:hypothetical protein
MDEFSTTSDHLDQTDEDILTYTVSDEELEAAAGMAEGQQYTPNTNIPNCSLSPGQCCMEGIKRAEKAPPHPEP